MTDFTSANLKGWENNDALAPLLNMGILDMAVFDAESSNESIELLRSGVSLSPPFTVDGEGGGAASTKTIGTITNPIIAMRESAEKQQEDEENQRRLEAFNLLNYEEQEYWMKKARNN